eukprot:6464371-Pyramimonas_sp.AAC.1
MSLSMVTGATRQILYPLYVQLNVRYVVGAKAHGRLYLTKLSLHLPKSTHAALFDTRCAAS